MAHSSRPQRQFPIRKRSKVWSDGPLTTVLTVTGNGVTGWTLGQTSLGGVTIGRVHGICSFVLTAATTIGDGFAGALGIGIVTADAFAAGSGSMPSPTGDQDWGGWLFHKHFDLHAATATEGDGMNALSNYTRMEIDTKAMRKMAPNETIFATVGVVITGTATMLVNGNTRMLALLS